MTRTAAAPLVRNGRADDEETGRPRESPPRCEPREPADPRNAASRSGSFAYPPTRRQLAAVSTWPLMWLWFMPTAANRTRGCAATGGSATAAGPSRNVLRVVFSSGMGEPRHEPPPAHKSSAIGVDALDGPFDSHAGVIGTVANHESPRIRLKKRERHLDHLRGGRSSRRRTTWRRTARRIQRPRRFPISSDRFIPRQECS